LAPLLAICLVSGISTAGVAAAPGDVISPAQRDSVAAKIDRQGSARLIVTLKAESEPDLRNPRAAYARNPLLQARRKAAVARLQERAQTRLPPGRVVRRLKNQASLVVQADGALFQALQGDSAVLHLQEDRILRPVLDESVPLVGADITAATGFDGAGWAVAVLDSGVDKTHGFIFGKVVAEACFSSSDSGIGLTSLCPNGESVQIGTGSGVNCSGTDGCGHGTHVAGIAAGAGGPFDGVAPGADIIAIQVFSRLANPLLCVNEPECIVAFESDVIAALEYLYDNVNSFAIASVNLSLGGEMYTDAASCDAANTSTKAAIDDLRAVGITTVIASGNEYATNAIASPACISTAVSVGATTNVDTVAAFSNSASWLSLLAPGTAIYSSVPGNGYASWSGTSMATPHVAGAFAVLKSQSPAATSEELLNALTSTGLPVTDSRNSIVTSRIAVNEAADSLDGAPPPTSVIVDDQDPNTERAGNWLVSSGPDPWLGHSLYSTGDASFRWLPGLEEAGSREVFAWWTYHANRGIQVPYTIAHAGGRNTVVVNQRDPALAGQWVSLGVYEFAGDGSGHVEVAGGNGQACADAVRLAATSAPPNQPPVVDICSPANGAVITEGDSLALEGAASDPEDGDLSRLISWHSNLDNDLGSGTPLVTSALTVGDHTITARVTDSGGSSGQASIALTVESAGSGGVELIVDNIGPGTSQSGNWSVSSGPAPWQGQSVYNNNNNYFRWQLDIPQTAEYDVYAWWTYHVNRSTSVPYYINHAGGVNVVQVNQRDPANGGRWVLLGSYTFYAGESHYVEVSSVNGQASADAVRLVNQQAPGNTAPSITISLPGDGTSFTAGDDVTMAAIVVDAEDGDISESIVWTSSRDGLLGSGASLTSSSLSVGAHVITAEVTDSGDETAVDDVSILVNPIDSVEVVVDDQDPNTSNTGQWLVSSGPNPWSGRSVYNNAGNSFRWLPSLDQPGNYAVYTWWTYHANRATEVPYRINHAGGVSTVNKNQRDEGQAGQWILLGVYPFDGDGSGYVEVSSENGQASADAVKFVMQ
jgi:subtilisin family serine protease